MSGTVLVTDSSVESINKALLNLSKSSSASSSSSSSILNPLTNPISKNTSYILPENYSIGYKIYIPSDYLIASSGGPYVLTIQSPKLKNAVYVPIIKNGDTLLSGSLLFDIYIDESGNVTTGSWKIDGYNTNGFYSLFSTKSLNCRRFGAWTSNSAAIITWTFPFAFIDTTYTACGGADTTNQFGFCGIMNESSWYPATTYAYFRSSSGKASTTLTAAMSADGRWIQ